jgi:Tfp pilus assembly protein PilE
MTNRRGFAWYEVVMTLAIVGSVTALAIPMTEAYRRDGVASAVLADIDSVRAGVFRFYSDSGYFPAQVGFTAVPETLAPYLPAGFSFQRSYGSLDYKNWVLSAPYSETMASNVVGVSVVTRDPRVGAAAMERYGENPKFSVGTNRMFLIFGG